MCCRRDGDTLDTLPLKGYIIATLDVSRRAEMVKTTKSQREATASLHDRIRAVNARFGVKQDDAKRHLAAAKRLRKQ